MVAVAPAGAPNRDDAALSAEAVIAAGAEEVLLFGSVARGTAGPHSDIDLVAIFADLDYARRHVHQRRLQAAATSTWPVQVHVTDRPEWRARVERVATSFERRAADEAVVVATVADRKPVDWDKEMVLPMSDPHEALRHFVDRALPRLQELAAAAHQDPDESDPYLSPAERELARRNRMVRVCTAAALACETSLKALAILHGKPTPTEKDLKGAGHVFAAVLALVPEPAQGQAAAVFARLGVDLDVLSAWRWRGTYPDDMDVIHADADRLAVAYAAMAPEIAGVLAAHLQKELAEDPTMDEAAARWARLARRIADNDVRLGTPRHPGAPNP